MIDAPAPAAGTNREPGSIPVPTCPDANPDPDAPASAVFDPDRLAALRARDLLDTPAEEAFDRFTRLAGRVLGAPVAVVSLVDDRRQFFKSAIGLPAPWDERRETPLSHSFCKHVVAAGAPLVIPDARRDPRLAQNGAVADLGVVAYAGVPLKSADGRTLGAFCVIDGVPRDWDPEDVAALREIAASLDLMVERRFENGALADALAAADAANRAKSAFLAHMSHEIRTPLNGILEPDRKPRYGICATRANSSS